MSRYKCPHCGNDKRNCKASCPTRKKKEPEAFMPWPPYEPPRFVNGWLKIDLRPEWREKSRAELLKILPWALCGESKHKEISI